MYNVHKEQEEAVKVPLPTPIRSGFHTVQGGRGIYTFLYAHPTTELLTDPGDGNSSNPRETTPLRAEPH